MNKHILIPEPGTVLVQDAPMPQPKEGEALVRVLLGGICGSDLGTYRGTFVYSSYPRIPGHELAVEVVEAPENPYGVRAGMLATVNPYFNCGTCYPCREGRVNCCVGNQTMGAQRDGGFAKYLAIPVERIFAPEGLGERETALVEPFCISYHGVKRAAVRPGEKVLIIGAGTIGIFAMLAAKHCGAEVHMADVAAKKLDRAVTLGAAGTCVNNTAEALADYTRTVTNGDGFAVTVEAVGHPATFQSAVDAAAFAGRVVLIGISGKPLDGFRFNDIQKKELALYGSRNATRQDFLDVIGIIREDGLRTDVLVTDTFRMDEAARAFKHCTENAGDVLKVLIDFRDGA